MSRAARVALTVPLLLAAGACSAGDDPVDTPSATESKEESAVDVCTPAPPDDPPRGAEGLRAHRVRVHTTTDGVSLTEGVVVREGSSVPDGVAREDGTVLVYFVNADDGAMWVGRLDGEQLVDLAPVVIDGVERAPSAVDPDAFLLDDGSVRLAYFQGFGPPDPSGATREHRMCLADSRDGVTFSTVAEAIVFEETATDPSLVRLDDGSWLMAVSLGQTTVVAASEDGLVFVEVGRFEIGGVPEITMADGVLRLYTCRDGLSAFRSDDRGRSWTPEASRLTDGCDPSRIVGTDLFLTKGFDPDAAPAQGAPGPVPPAGPPSRP